MGAPYPGIDRPYPVFAAARRAQATVSVAQMSRRRNAYLVPLAFVGLVGLVGCGGDDAADDDSTTTAAAADVDETTEVTKTSESTGTTESTETTETTAGTESTDGTETTTDGSGAGSAPSGEVAEFCGPMEDLANYNAEAPVPDISGDWSELQDELLASAEEALPLYDDAIAAAPDEVRGNLETLRDYSDEVLGALGESTSFEDFFGAIGTPSSEVTSAVQELDTYISENCGFELTESG
ncbi:MAG: hypothetical protein ACR2HP_15385 [Ilumatobacteraceae bacterium]